MINLPDVAKWAARLDQWKPWLPHGPERGIWKPFWGPRPDSAGIHPSIPPAMLADWRAFYTAQMAKARAA